MLERVLALSVQNVPGTAERPTSTGKSKSTTATVPPEFCCGCTGSNGSGSLLLIASSETSAIDGAVHRTRRVRRQQQREKAEAPSRAASFLRYFPPPSGP